MNENLTNLLEGEISREFGEIKNLSSGSKEQTQVITNIIKLYQLMIDQIKADAEIKKFSAEHRLALKKLREDGEAKTKQLDAEEKRYARDYELKAKQYELDKLKRDDEVNNNSIEHARQMKENIFKWCIGITEVVLPLTFYAVWMSRGFEFERTGTYTSTTFRGLFNNFKPIKK